VSVCDIQKADHVSDTEDEADDETSDSKGADYNYILNMSLWSLTNEKRDALLKLRDDKAKELRVLHSKTPPDLWKEDLDKLVVELDVCMKFITSCFDVTDSVYCIEDLTMESVDYFLARFYRVKPSGARYCQGKLSVCLSVCNVKVL